MKRFALATILCLTTIICQAQEHLRFMDIPIEGTIEYFCSQLIKEKGLAVSNIPGDEQFLNIGTKKLTGDFYGIKNCTFYVGKHKRLDNVSSVIVEDTLFALDEVDENRLVSLHDERYGNHEINSTNHSVWYKWKTVNGDVELLVDEEGFAMYYTDYTENEMRELVVKEFEEEWERQTIKEICGIPFGTSYEKAEKILENKYGTPSIYSDKTRIVYDNKSYAGIQFDDIIFLFQSDGYKSYFNGCVFILETSSLSQAKEKRDMLYKELSRKYDMDEGEDDNGNKFYYGGHSPVPFDGFGFSIDIIKYDNRPRIPYAARLMYGRYNYVDEEF